MQENPNQNDITKFLIDYTNNLDQALNNTTYTNCQSDLWWKAIEEKENLLSLIKKIAKEKDTAIKKELMKDLNNIMCIVHEKPKKRNFKK